MVDYRRRALVFPGAPQVLWVSTAAFTACFAIWTICSVIGLGVISAIAAYDGFCIAKAYGPSIEVAGSAYAALRAFPVFYLTGIVLVWAVHGGPRGILRTY